MPNRSWFKLTLTGLNRYAEKKFLCAVIRKGTKVLYVQIGVTVIILKFKFINFDAKIVFMSQITVAN